MEINTETIDDGIFCIKLAGRLDSEGSRLIETKMAAYMSGDDRRIIIDLAGVSFLASLGIRVFLLNAKSVHKRGGKVALYGPVAEVAKVIKMVGIDSLIPLCDSEDAAKAAVAA